MTSKSADQDPPVELPPAGRGHTVYKRRFWGLAQLVLLNIVVSWDVRIVLYSCRGPSIIPPVSTNTMSTRCSG